MTDWLYNHFYNTVCGIFFAIIGYFTEIQGAIHVMWAAILLDLFAGILASVYKRNEKFSMVKFFLAIDRAFAVTVFVALLYAIDRETHQEIAASYNIAAWIISGFYAWGWLENMGQLTGSRIFEILKGFLKKRVEDNTGIDISEKEAENG